MDESQRGGLSQLCPTMQPGGSAPRLEVFLFVLHISGTGQPLPFAAPFAEAAGPVAACYPTFAAGLPATCPTVDGLPYNRIFKGAKKNQLKNLCRQHAHVHIRYGTRPKTMREPKVLHLRVLSAAASEQLSSRARTLPDQCRSTGAAAQDNSTSKPTLEVEVHHTCCTACGS